MIRWKNRVLGLGKPWETLGNLGKPWKPWETLGNLGKLNKPKTSKNCFPNQSGTPAERVVVQQVSPLEAQVTAPPRGQIAAMDAGNLTWQWKKHGKSMQKPPLYIRIYIYYTFQIISIYFNTIWLFAHVLHTMSLGDFIIVYNVFKSQCVKFYHISSDIYIYNYIIKLYNYNMYIYILYIIYTIFYHIFLSSFHLNRGSRGQGRQWLHLGRWCDGPGGQWPGACLGSHAYVYGTYVYIHIYPYIMHSLYISI